MKRIQLLGTLCLLLSLTALQAQGNAHQEYIERFKEIAIREMERAGIPASIKLAQGILESAGGGSELARRANNHFGIKCGSAWDGKKYYKKDDDYNDRGELIESCFRHYKNPDASYIAHSEFLRDPRKQYRYGFLFRLDPTDYKGWARGLKQAGYATSATYSIKLIDIIERYDLHRYDLLSSTDVIAGGTTVPGLGDEGFDDSNAPTVIPGLVFRNNDVQYALAAEGETLQNVALRTGTDLARIVGYNESRYTRNQPLPQGTVVYVQPKRNSFRGKRQWHYVKEGETLFSISQLYGIDLGRLIRRNQLEEGQMPVVGERLKIRGWNVSDPPRIQSEGPTAPQPPKDDELNFPKPEPPVITEPSPRPIVVEDEEFDLDDGFDFSDDLLDPITPEGSAPWTSGTPQEPGEPVSPVVPDFPDTGFGNNNSGGTTPPVQPEEPATPAAPQNYHTVAKGDTLYNISRRYSLSVDQLKALNNLSGNTIFIGQQLRVK